MREEERSKISVLKFHLKKVGNEEQSKIKICRRKEIRYKQKSVKLKKNKKQYRNLTKPKSRGKKAEWSGDAKCEAHRSEGVECLSVLPGLCRDVHHGGPVDTVILPQYKQCWEAGIVLIAFEILKC